MVRNPSKRLKGDPGKKGKRKKGQSNGGREVQLKRHNNQKTKHNMVVAKIWETRGKIWRTTAKRLGKGVGEKKEAKQHSSMTGRM